jgi:hypothetical protein
MMSASLFAPIDGRPVFRGMDVRLNYLSSNADRVVETLTHSPNSLCRSPRLSGIDCSQNKAALFAACSGKVIVKGEAGDGRSVYFHVNQVKTQKPTWMRKLFD